jgi:hypothetical protein
VDARDFVIYFAFGLSIDSDIKLPLSGRDVVSAGPGTDVTVTLGAVDRDTLSLAPLPKLDDEDWVQYAWGEDRVVLEFTGLTVEVRLDRPVIRVDNVGAHADEHVSHVVLDHVIPRWSALQGDLVLHGGSMVAPLGGAVVVVGDTGQGKSSMVTGLSFEGWRLLGDDGCRIVSDDDGWLAVPSYAGVRLLGDSRRALVPRAPSEPLTEGADKHRVILPGPTSDTPARLRLIVELGDHTPDIRTQSMTLSEATAMLTRHSFHLAKTQAGIAQQAFETSSAVAASVRCLRLDYPRAFDVYPQLHEELQSAELLVS